MNGQQMRLLAVLVSFATSCQPFIICPYSSSRTKVNSRLHLFDSLLQKQENKNRRAPNGSSIKNIPDEELHFIGSGYGLERDATPPFPYSIDLAARTTNGGKRKQPSKLMIRHLEDADITNILPEIVREFGAMIPSTPTNEPGDELADKIENFLFSLTVLIGLTQRVVRREKGYSATNSACPDHNVICLVEQQEVPSNSGETAYSEQIVGIAELSWQPPNPNSNAPPFVLPYFMKTLISRYSPNRAETEEISPVGYISNVLVWKTRRGRGYGRILMAALEGIAKIWGCDDVRLHVDANEYSGRIARGMYYALGYVGVPDRGVSKNNNLGYEWMGPRMANQGLYLVDGVPLLYLRKDLREE